jgi:hypothetical protein
MPPLSEAGKGDLRMITEEGKRLFGEFLRGCGQKNGLISERAIAQFLTQETGIRVPEAQINSLVSSLWKDKFKFDYMFAILDSGLLRFPEGVENARLLEFNDVMEILRGHLNPFTGERLDTPTAKASGILGS